jgi:hypothetical protein
MTSQAMMMMVAGPVGGSPLPEPTLASLTGIGPSELVGGLFIVLGLVAVVRLAASRRVNRFRPVPAALDLTA